MTRTQQDRGGAVNWEVVACALYEGMHASRMRRGDSWADGSVPFGELDETLGSDGLNREDVEAGARAAVAKYIELNGSDPVDVRAVVADALGEAPEPLSLAGYIRANQELARSLHEATEPLLHGTAGEQALARKLRERHGLETP